MHSRVELSIFNNLNVLQVPLQHLVHRLLELCGEVEPLLLQPGGALKPLLDAPAEKRIIYYFLWGNACVVNYFFQFLLAEGRLLLRPLQPLELYRVVAEDAAVVLLVVAHAVVLFPT